MPANIAVFGHQGVEVPAEGSLLFARMGKMARMGSVQNQE
jgi:hypothetical protein